MFEDIDDEERERVEAYTDEELDVAPDFGNTGSEWRSVRAFYSFWEVSSSNTQQGQNQKLELSGDKFMAQGDKSGAKYLRHCSLPLREMAELLVGTKFRFRRQVETFRCSDKRNS